MADEQNNKIGFSVDVTTGKSEENIESVIKKIDSLKEQIGTLKKQTKDADSVKLSMLKSDINGLQRQLDKLNASYGSWIQQSTKIDTKPIGNVKKQLQELTDILKNWDGQASTFDKQVASHFLIPNSAIDQAKQYQEVIRQIQGLSQNGKVGSFKATEAITQFSKALTNAKIDAKNLTTQVEQVQKVLQKTDVRTALQGWMKNGGSLDEFLKIDYSQRLPDLIKQLKDYAYQIEALGNVPGAKDALNGLSSEILYQESRLKELRKGWKDTSEQTKKTTQEQTKAVKQSAMELFNIWVGKGGQGSILDGFNKNESYKKDLADYTRLKDELKHAMDNSTVSDKTTIDLYKKAMDELTQSIAKAKAALRDDDGKGKAKQSTSQEVTKAKQSYADAFREWNGKGNFLSNFTFESSQEKLTQLRKMRDQLDYAFSKSADTSELKKFKTAIDEITKGIEEAQASLGKYKKKAQEVVVPKTKVVDDSGKTQKALSEYARMQKQLTDVQDQIKSNYVLNYKKNDDLYASNLAKLIPMYKELTTSINGAERSMTAIAFRSDFLGNSFDRLLKRGSWIISNFFAGGTIGMAQTMYENLANMETNMAQFSQVMSANEHTVNAFGQSLATLDFNKIIEGVHSTSVQSEQFRKDLEYMKTSLVDLAVKYGEANEDVIKSATLWGRKYKDNNTILTMTDAAMKLAVADSFSITEANKNLESSIVQWGFQIRNNNDAMIVSNKIIDSWTALAHKMALSAQDLSAANQRAAQSMNAVGLSFDEGQALIASALANTQQAGGEIGNAIKSIMGSIHSDKAINEIKSLGIEMYKTGENGQKEFRDVGEVMIDLMLKTQGTKENLEDLLKDISGGKLSHLPQPSVMAA